MINNLPIIIFFGYLAFIFLLNLELIYYFQIKEYRLDRIKQGTNRNKLIFIIFIVFLSILSSYFFYRDFESAPNLVLYFSAICFLTFGVWGYIKLVRMLRTKVFIKPAKSIRNILILFPTIVFISISIGIIANFLIRSTSNTGLVNILLIMIAPALIWSTLGSSVLMNFLTTPLAWLKRRRIIKKAKQIIADQKNLKVIAITGSYGKTSTKEILATILRTKYTTQTTFNNFNTAVGVAKSVIIELSDKKADIFISEMGAYRPGEISDATKVTPPDISIITNIGKAHIDLYGSVDNIKIAKFEIMEGLKEGGTGIFNANNAESHSLIKKFKGDRLVFSSSGFENSDLEISEVEWNGFDVKFKTKFEGKSKTMHTTLVGKQLIDNLFAAITAALKLGMSLDEIAKVLKESTFQSSHFKIKKNKKFVLINDSYNANPVGVDEALEYLKSLDFENKVLITKGILEMDTEIDLIYKNLAKNIVLSATKVITTDKRLWHAILNLESKVETELCKDENQFKIAIEKVPNKNTAVLISGRIHKKYIKTLEKYAN